MSSTPTPYTATITDNNLGISKSQTFDATGNLTIAKTIPSTGSATELDYAYLPIGEISAITNNTDGSSTTMGYDNIGNQTSLTDPDAGTIKYRYNGFSQLVSQHDVSNQVDTLIYDQYGRLITKKSTDKNSNISTTSYVYSSTPGSLGLLQSVSRDNVTETYSYDALCRPKSITVSTNGLWPDGLQLPSTTYIYNNAGQLGSIAYPSGLTVNYQYDGVGNLKEIDNASGGSPIWTGNNVNALNQWTKFTLGNGLVTQWGYDATYQLNSIQTGTGGSVQNLRFTFNAMGQLKQRTSGVGISILTENFDYDAMNRLKDSQVGTTGTLFKYTYTANGNIDITTLAGKYTYNTNVLVQPHAVLNVSNPSGAGTSVCGSGTKVTYNAENKITSISYNDTSYSDVFTYGVGGNRFRVDFSGKQSPQITSKIYIGSSEFGYNGTSNVYKRTIISAPTGVCAVYQDSGSSKNMYYIHTDYQGSWLAITDNTGAVKNRYSYDAWGRPRDPATWNLDSVGTNNAVANLTKMQPRFDHGYTGHEMLCGFGLINMNGRVYDPYLQRFLSPDNFVQDPANTQSLNRYSYCMNNPLMFTDPGGNMFLKVPFYTPSVNSRDWIGGSAGPGDGMGGQSISCPYEWIDGTDLYVEKSTGAVVSFDEVSNNYLIPNGGCTTLYGSDAANYLYSNYFNYNIVNSPTLSYMPSFTVTQINPIYSINIDPYRSSTYNYNFTFCEDGNCKFENYSFTVQYSTVNVEGYSLGVSNEVLSTGTEGETVEYINHSIEGFGTGLENFGGTFRLYNSSGFSPKLYEVSELTGRGWGGNGFVRTFSAAEWGSRIGKGSVILGIGLGAYSTYQGYKEDGNTFGIHAQVAAAESAGGIVGGWAGAEAGAWAGAAIGGLITSETGGWGAVPGAFIGGILGAFGVGMAGSEVGKRAVLQLHR